MASTNKTEKLGLSQYIATDKPTYLVDYNNDMSKIDANAVLTSTSIASNVASIEANRQSIDTVNGRIDTTNENLTTLQNTVTSNKQDADDKNTDVLERITQVNRNVQDLEDEFDQFRAGTGEPFTSIKDSIAVNTTSIASNKVEINSLDARVEALEEGGGGSIPSDYEQLKTNVQTNTTSINALQTTCAPVITSTTIHIGTNENSTQISKTPLLPVDIVYDDTAKTLGWKEKGADTVNPFKGSVAPVAPKAPKGSRILASARVGQTTTDVTLNLNVSQELINLGFTSYAIQPGSSGTVTAPTKLESISRAGSNDKYIDISLTVP